MWVRASRFLLVCSLLPVGGAAAARPDRVAVTVGHGWALVHEEYRPSFRVGEQVLEFEHVPAEADLSSVILRSRRFPLELREWHRESPAAPTTGPGLQLNDEGAVVWTPDAPDMGAPEAERVDRPLRCTVYAPSAGRRRVMLSYLVTGFDWSAQYQVAVRGELAEESEPLSVDLFGTARIENPTSLSLPGVTLTLVGAEEPPAPARKDEPGILMLDDDSPLSELWKPSEPDVMTEFAYRVPDRVDIAARGETDIFLARTRRASADAVYVVTAEAFPLSDAAMRPLPKMIVFKNLAAFGLGQALPPGPVKVFLGGKRTHLLQEGVMPRTEPNGDIRIGLGVTEDVLGARRPRGRSETVDGLYEEGFEVIIQNKRDSVILAEINEKPPVQLRWDVMRANEKYEVKNRRLRFNTRVDANTEHRVYYRLRVHEPGI
jgi:hypothetical protein